MDHLLAKTKGKTGDYYKVISNKSIFKMPADLKNSREYDSEYKLEENRWFAIEGFSKKNYSIDFISRRFVSTDYSQIKVDDYKTIDYLCAYQSGVYYFQKLSSSQVIYKYYFSMSEAPTLIINKPIIVINSFADGIYIKEKDILYFKTLNSISTIFKGIEILYKEATQLETKTFLENDFINLAEEYKIDDVKKANRKRIKAAMEILEKFNKNEKKEIFSYVREYCEDLTFNETDKNFGISNEEELKKLLYGIEQRYYTTRFGAERRVAHSITPLKALIIKPSPTTSPKNKRSLKS